MANIDRIDQAIASITDVLLEAGMHEYQAAPLADKIYNGLAKSFDGERVRFSVEAKALHEREQRVLDAWNKGDHRDAICERNHISSRTFYRIVGVSR